MNRTSDRVIRFLVDHARCGECGGEFEAEHVHVIRQQDYRVWDLGAVCHRCQTLTLLRAVVRPPRDEGVPTPIESREPADELTPAERTRYAALPPVGPDDVLDVAAFLQDFDGDFRDLFGREQSE